MQSSHARKGLGALASRNANPAGAGFRCRLTPEPKRAEPSRETTRRRDERATTASHVVDAAFARLHLLYEEAEAAGAACLFASRSQVRT